MLEELATLLHHCHPLKEVRMLELRNITQVASNELQPPCPFKPLKFKLVAYN
jgi:hypothetical protein